MAPRETHAQRIARIEDIILPILIEIAMLKIVLERLLNIDLDRCEDTGFDPFRFVIEEDLADASIAASLGATPYDWMTARAVEAALDFLGSVDEDDAPHGGAANDD